MISIDLCQFYGTDSEKELMTAIEELRKIGMPDDDIQGILDRSKGESKDEM
jgi:transcriptional/translational regulatory protein YebC/TACO1